MKKLLTLSLLLVSAAPAFGANNFKHIVTIGKAIVISPIAISKALAYAYRNQDVFMHRALVMHVERESILKKITSLEKETGISRATIAEKYKPVSGFLPGSDLINPVHNLKRPFSREENLAILCSKLSSLPEIPKAEKILHKHSPLLLTGLLAQIPGTPEYKNEQVYPHAQELIKKIGSKEVKSLLYPVEK